MFSESLSMIERMCAYASATGLPPTGVHRRLTDQVVIRMGVRCDSCNESGLQFQESRRQYCLDCHGFLRRLSAADVVRLYQIVTARFPELHSRVALVQEAADRWHCGRSLPVTAPKYFGLEPPPAAIPLIPDENTQLVASITWRSGGRSEYLWTRSAANDLDILCERVPELLLENGAPWTEVFAWAHAGIDDPALSARRLLKRGWAESNPAYEWLGAPRMSTFLGLTKFFFVNRDAMMSEKELQPLFFAAVNARSQAAAGAFGQKPMKAPAARNTVNIGPYPFGAKLADARHPMPKARGAALFPASGATGPPVEARILPFRRVSKRPVKDFNGDRE